MYYRENNVPVENYSKVTVENGENFEVEKFTFKELKTKFPLWLIILIIVILILLAVWLIYKVFKPKSSKKLGYPFY